MIESDVTSEFGEAPEANPAASRYSVPKAPTRASAGK